MYRRLLTYLRTRVAAERSELELRTLQNARTLANGYAGQIQRAVDTIEQTVRFVKYDWEARQGALHLGYADEHGLFLDASRLLVAIVDGEGRVLTSTAPTGLSPPAVAYILPRVRSGMPVAFFVDEVPAEGRNGRKHRLLFSWELSDSDGRFAAAVVVAVDPAYFTTGEADAIFRQGGLLAIVGDDGRTRALRSEGPAVTVRKPEFVHAPPLRVSSGSELVDGPAWFGDGRPRYVGWEHVDRRGVNAVVGLDQETALAPWTAMRAAWINTAWAGTGIVLLFTVLAMSNSVRLARRDRDLRVIRDTYRMATEASNEGFYMLRPQWDEQGEVTDFEVIDCNRRAAELVACSPRDLIGRKVTALYEGETLQTRMDSLRRAMETGYNEVTLGRPKEHFPAKWVNLKMFRYGDNLAVSAREVTEDRVHEEELLRRSNEDPLTRLPNRYWVEGHLRDAIGRAEKEGKMFALLFIDLDGFKAINDTWGHAAGDELLCTAAHRLKEAVRPHDCVTRFGGDEFVIVLDNIGDALDAAQASERIQRAFRRSIRLSYGEYVVGTSIGISLFPTDGKEPRALLQNADVAMYSAKMNERGSYRFFDGRFHDQLKARLERIRELRHALADDQFVMYYEPRVNLADGSITSAGSARALGAPDAGRRLACRIRPPRRGNGPRAQARRPRDRQGLCPAGPLGEERRQARARIDQHFAAPVQRYGRRADAAAGTRTARGRPAPDRGRIDGVVRDERDGVGRGRDPRDPRDRDQGAAGRFRHRLFVAVAAVQAQFRRSQDRPRLHRPARQDRGRDRDRPGDRHHGARARDARGRGGCRDDGAGRLAARARLRRDPGLAHFEGDAAGGVAAGGAQFRAAGGVGLP